MLTAAEYDALIARREQVVALIREDDFLRGLDWGQRLSSCDPRPLGMGVRPAGDGVVVERLRVAAGFGPPKLDDGTPVRVVENNQHAHLLRCAGASRAIPGGDVGSDMAGVVVRVGEAIHNNGRAAAATAPGHDPIAREATR